jgi:hypothetical protein
LSFALCALLPALLFRRALLSLSSSASFFALCVGGWHFVCAPVFFVLYSRYTRRGRPPPHRGLSTKKEKEAALLLRVYSPPNKQKRRSRRRQLPFLSPPPWAFVLPLLSFFFLFWPCLCFRAAGAFCLCLCLFTQRARFCSFCCVNSRREHEAAGGSTCHFFRHLRVFFFLPSRCRSPSALKSQLERRPSSLTLR